MAERFCPYCGEPALADWSFCAGCGSGLGGASKRLLPTESVQVASAGVIVASESSLVASCLGEADAALPEVTSSVGSTVSSPVPTSNEVDPQGLARRMPPDVGAWVVRRTADWTYPQFEEITARLDQRNIWWITEAHALVVSAASASFVDDLVESVAGQPAVDEAVPYRFTSPTGAQGARSVSGAHSAENSMWPGPAKGWLMLGFVWFSGWGALAMVAAAGLLAGAITSGAASARPGLLLAGAVLAMGGRYVNNRSMAKHTMYWLPVEYWGIVIAIVGLLGLGER